MFSNFFSEETEFFFLPCFKTEFINEFYIQKTRLKTVYIISNCWKTRIEVKVYQVKINSMII